MAASPNRNNLMCTITFSFFGRVWACRTAWLLFLIGWSAGALRAQCPGQGQVCDEVEAAALRRFYNATGGPQWTNQTNWGQGSTHADFATWFGVTVDGGDVVGLVLDGNNLQGPLPDEFSAWPRLQTLEISSNHLSGPLPASLPSCTQLRHLNLNYNQLTGRVPDAWGAVRNCVT